MVMIFNDSRSNKSKKPGQIRFKVMGVDVGRVQDRSAIVVAGVEVSPREPGVPEIVVGYFEAYLGSVPDTAQHIHRIWRYPPLSGEAHIVVDRNGLGIGLCDTLDYMRVPFCGITTTAGREEREKETEGVILHSDSVLWTVPKAILVSDSVVAFEQGRLRFIPSPGSDALKQEMAAFVPKVSTRTGHTAYEAETGHDDLVFSLLLAVWRAKRLAWHYAGYQEDASDCAESGLPGEGERDGSRDGSMTLSQHYPAPDGLW